IVVSGVDYSSSLVNRASQKLNGQFAVGDIRDLRFLPDAAYDCVFSFSAFHYLDSAKDAKRAVREMVRLAKPGGVLMIGEVNDLAKKSMALELRKASHKDQPKLSEEELDHLYLPKELFKEMSSQLGLAITFLDHGQLKLPTYQAARYRYTVYCWKE
ncbi:MAG: class I SAM-dependent methyltransferase, partial [Terriglobia bacterium]